MLKFSTRNVVAIGEAMLERVNPGMGWPLALSAGLMGGGRPDLLAAMAPLALGLGGRTW